MDNTREKLIELLERLNLPSECDDDLEWMADFLIANGVTVPDKNVGKWIPVTERLPDNNAYINVTTDGVVVQAYWHNDRFYAFTAVGVATVGGVTHWMPLPEPPKEG
jgi:hypothetical protein